jgi:Mn2+/Fe2+ NRAMP family transporter
MKNAVRLLLGVVTSIGGFIEAGSISTSAQAGALYGFRLLWAIALAAICVAFLVEMAGRLAAVSSTPWPRPCASGSASPSTSGPSWPSCSSTCSC